MMDFPWHRLERISQTAAVSPGKIPNTPHEWRDSSLGRLESCPALALSRPLPRIPLGVGPPIEPSRDHGPYVDEYG